MRYLKRKLNTSIRPFYFFMGISCLLSFANRNKNFSVIGNSLIFTLLAVFSILRVIHHKRIPFSYKDISPYILWAMLVYAFASLFTIKYFSLGIFLTIELVLLVFLALSLSRPKTIEINFIAECHVFSAVIISIFMLIKPTLFNGIPGRRTMMPFAGVAIDPNYLSTYLVFVSIILIEKVRKSIGTKKYIAVSFLILVSCCIIMSGSRGSVIGLILALIVLYHNFLLNEFKKRSITFLAIILVTIVICLIVWNSIPIHVKDRFFVLQNYMDGSNITRLRLWENSLKAIGEKPLLGNGVVDISLFHKSIYDRSGDAHNTVLAFLEQVGILGIMPFVLIATLEFKIALKRRDTISIAIFTALGVMFFIIDGIVAVPFWHMVFYIHMRNHIDCLSSRSN